MASEKLIAWCRERGLDPTSEETTWRLIEELTRLREGNREDCETNGRSF